MANKTIYTLDTILRGFKANIAVALVVGTYGIVMGTIAAHKGITIVELSLMSASVFAGAAQLVVVGMWNSPVPTLEIILATLIVNLRYFLICASLRPIFKSCNLYQRLAGIHLVADENWAVTMQAHAKRMASPGFLLGGGLVILLCWVGGGDIGLIFGARLPPLEKLGFDFALTAVFLSLLVTFWRDIRQDCLSWVVTAMVAVIAHHYLPGKWYIVIGMLAGCMVTAFVKDGD